MPKIITKKCLLVANHDDKKTAVLIFRLLPSMSFTFFTKLLIFQTTELDKCSSKY